MVELKFAGRSKKSQGVLFYFPLQEEKEKGEKKNNLQSLAGFIWTIANFTYL